MSNDKKLTPEDAARKLQGMVSLGIPDNKFSATRPPKAQGTTGKLQGYLFSPRGLFRPAASVHNPLYPRKTDDDCKHHRRTKSNNQ